MTGERLRGSLERVRRHLQLRSGGDVNLSEFGDGFAAAWPGEDSHIVLALSGKEVFEEVRDLVRATQGPSLRWQDETLSAVTDEAIRRLARGELSAEEAASYLSSFHAKLPEQRVVVLDVHGLSIEEPIEICGATFYPAQVGEAVRDELFDLPVQEFALRRVMSVAGRPNDALAEIRIRADAGMAALNARLRVLGALCILRQSLRTEEPLEQQQEYTAGIERTVHPEFLEGPLGSAPQTWWWGDVYPQVLRHDVAGLARVRERPGIRALERLCVSLPDVVPGSRMECLLRAIQLLGRSIDGDADDRFLRRWSALEALVGSPSPKTTEAVARRAAWLVEPTARRPSRERWLKSLYKRRSQLSHGAVDRTPFDFDAVAFGAFCFDLLELVAARDDTPEIESLYLDSG